MKRFAPARRRLVAVALAVAGATTLTPGAGAVTVTPGAAQVARTGQDAPACTAVNGPPGRTAPTRPTTITTIEQAYHCVFAHYYGGEKLDNRLLLTAAFAGFARELERRGLDAPEATMPALSGDRHKDWAAFAAVYSRVTGALPADDTVRQSLAAATMNAMVDRLADNHARWARTQVHPDAGPGTSYGLGIVTSPSMGLIQNAPHQALAPLYVRTVTGGPAAGKGLRPGDVIESVNGAPPFAGGVLSTGATAQLFPAYPDSRPVRIKLRRPATGRTWTVTLTPALFTPDAEASRMVTAKAVRGDIAYVKLAGFGMRSADTVLKAIDDVGKGTTPRGVVLDLRGNRGGSPEEAARLVSAWVHGKVTAYHCDVDGDCLTSPTVDSVPLLDLPLVVLTDRDCGSACDHFAAAVKDLEAGTLVGTRTGGIVSGAAAPYLLDDNSLLLLPGRRHLGPDREVVDGSGVAPDHYVPLTAEDVSAGKDPGLALALALLGR
ncbi:S41 family peptidase [Nonomuraea sp. NPDC003727]